MRSLLAFPILFLIALLQSAVLSRLPLLFGQADLMLVFLVAWATHPQAVNVWEWTLLGALFTAFLSALPWPLIFLSYASASAMARVLQRRAGRPSILLMLLTLFPASLLIGALSWGYVTLVRAPVPWELAFGQVISPSMLLNFLLAIPTFTIVQSLVKWIHPTAEE